MRNRVRELSGREYIDADSTLDEVLLFIPNESVWAFIHEQDPRLIDLAMQQKVVLCSPVSLFAVLAVIRQAVDQTRLARTSDEILQCLSAFRQQWTKYADAVDAVEKRFAAGPEEPRRPHRHPPARARAPARAHRRPARRPGPGRAARAAARSATARARSHRRSVGDVRPWTAEAG